MKIIGERLRILREGMKMTQAQIAECVGTVPTTVGRYENNVGMPPHKTLLWYADYFDVSMDYIYGRTDKPQGTLYDFRPKNMENNAEMREFIEMCFDPNSPMNDKLKQALFMLIDKENAEREII